MTLKRLASLAAELSQRTGQPPSETRDRVELQVEFRNGAEVEAFWNAIQACPGVGARLADEFGDETPMGDQPPEHTLDRPFRAVLTKPIESDVVFFLTVDGLRHFLDLSRLVGLPRYVLVAEDFEAFSTGTTEVRSWSAPTAATEALPVVIGDSPRKLVRDLSNDLIPRTAAAWVIADGGLPPGPVGDAFALTAARALPLTLVTEAWIQDGQVQVAVKGDRTITLLAPPTDRISREDHAALNTVAGWVYGHSDTEVRHTLFTNEVAREWRDSERWTGAEAVRLDIALRQAKVAYGHHLRAQAKDAIKSLSDLRKAVGEEVEKAATQTRELIATLWRDFAVAAGALAVRLAVLTTGSAETARATGFLLVGTALFVTYSFGLSVWLNQRFHRHAKKLRSNWHGRLYGFLGREEFEQLAVQPLSDVRRSYRIARLWVAFAYAVVVLALLWIGFHAVLAVDGAPTTPPPASGAKVDPVGRAD